ncbi:unnamed protein product [Ectocarpus sp. CCAP 1310/34]|nr:unnamed protein product [Ectocarpus sp. CCAP 1310/34]
MQVDRTIEIRGEEREVRLQQRKKHSRGTLLISQLLRKGTTEAAGKPVQCVVADEVELLEKGREYVEGIRERASKRGKRQPAAAAAASSAAAKKAKLKEADAALSDPLALAHDGGTRSGATPETSREEADAEERRSSAMDLMQNDPVLMERVRAMLDAGAAEQAAAKVAAIDAANTRALRASLQALKQHCNSSTGWTTYQTALAVAAGAGEHTCTDTDVCHPGQRCKPVESGGVSLAERANSLGIRHETFSDARWRMHNTNHDIAPKIAVSEGCYVDARRRMHKTNHDIAPKIAASEGCYVYNERKTRSDVTNPGNRKGAGGGAGYL